MKTIFFSCLFFFALVSNLYAIDTLFEYSGDGTVNLDTLPCTPESRIRTEGPGWVWYRCCSSEDKLDQLMGNGFGNKMDGILNDITGTPILNGPEDRQISEIGKKIRDDKIRQHIEKLKNEVKEDRKKVNSDLRPVLDKSKDLRDKVAIQLSSKATKHNQKSIEILKQIPLIDGLLESRNQTYKSNETTPLGKEIREAGLYANYAKRNSYDGNEGLVDTGLNFLAKADKAAADGNVNKAIRYLQESNDFIQMSLNPSPLMLNGENKDKFRAVKSFVTNFAKNQALYTDKIGEVVDAFNSKESNLTSYDQLNAFMAFTQTTLGLAYSKGKKVLKERKVGALEKGLTDVKGLLDAFDNIIEFGKGSISGLDISAGSIVHDFVESVESGLKAVLNPVKTYQEIADLIEKFDKDAFTRAVGDFFATKYDEFRKANPHDRGEMAGQLMGDIVLWALAPSSAPSLISARIAAQTKLASVLEKLSKVSKGIPDKVLGENFKIVNAYLVDEVGSMSFLADLHGMGVKNSDAIKKIFASVQKLGLNKTDDIKDLTKIAKKAAANEDFKVIIKNVDDYLEATMSGTGPKLPLNRVSDTFKKGRYYNRKLKKNEIFYKYHGVDNRTGKKYTWLVKDVYSSEDQLRKGLAILPEWGVKITKWTKFKAPKGTWVSEGLAAPQKLINSLPGGDYQAIITNVPKSWIIETVEAFK